MSISRQFGTADEPKPEGLEELRARVAALEARFPARPAYDRHAAHRAYMRDYMRRRRAKERGE